MKAGRVIDIVLQGILFFLAIIGLIVNDDNESRAIYVALVQIPMGILQLISALILSITAWKFAKEFMIIYWIWVLLYFIGLLFTGMLGRHNDEMLYAWFFSAWCIAIYYYVVCFIVGNREARHNELQAQQNQNPWQGPYPPQPPY